MDEMSRETISRYVSGILKNFIKQDNPLRHIDIEDIEGRIREGVMPIDVAPDGYYSGNQQKNQPRREINHGDFLGPLCRVFVDQVTRISEAVSSFSRIYGLERTRWPHNLRAL